MYTISLLQEGACLSYGSSVSRLMNILNELKYSFRQLHRNWCHTSNYGPYCDSAAVSIENLGQRKSKPANKIAIFTCSPPCCKLPIVGNIERYPIDLFCIYKISTLLPSSQSASSSSSSISFLISGVSSRNSTIDAMRVIMSQNTQKL